MQSGTNLKAINYRYCLKEGFDHIKSGEILYHNLSLVLNYYKEKSMILSYRALPYYIQNGLLLASTHCNEFLLQIKCKSLFEILKDPKFLIFDPDYEKEFFINFPEPYLVFFEIINLKGEISNDQKTQISIES